MARSRRGGASAPQHCKSTLKSCLKSGPALSASTGKSCFRDFNKCRSKKRKATGGKKKGKRGGKKK